MQKEVIQEETTFPDLETLNKNIKENDSLILHVNIRSLNANYIKLDILINRLKIEPYIIVCTERSLPNFQNFEIQEYKLYYNNSN